MKPQPATMFAALSGVVMLAAIVVGLIVIGSPGEYRLRRFDQKRVSDLVSISNTIRSYRLTHEDLPQKLDELAPSQPYITHSLRDPVGRPYEYAVKNAFSYELCAEFDTATDAITPANFGSIFEKHGIGRQCFVQEARPPARR
jgi:hypothetical protein